MNDDANLNHFIMDLINEKNLPGLTDERKAEIANEMQDLLIEQINRAIVDALPDEVLDKLNERMGQPDFDEAEMQKIVADSGIDVEKITADTLVRFRAFYLGTE